LRCSLRQLALFPAGGEAPQQHQTSRRHGQRRRDGDRSQSAFAKDQSLGFTKFVINRIDVERKAVGRRYGEFVETALRTVIVVVGQLNFGAVFSFYPLVSA
jgi:hypothetical protein